MKPRTKTVVVAVTAAVVLSILVGIALWNWYFIDWRTVPIEATVVTDGVIGINAGTDKLYFGTLAPETSSERRASFVAGGEARLVISIHGDVAGWVRVSQNNVRVRPGDRVELVFRLTPPAGTLPGNYTGYAALRQYRVLPWE